MAQPKNLIHMQTAKDHTRRLLLETAREAFLRKGFKAVSMREISRLSGVGLSNIYNYFPCKDDLLAVVLHPLLEAMDGMLDGYSRDEHLSLEIFTSEGYHRKYMQEVMGVIMLYRKELKLLFLDTQDSRFKNYWERWTEKSTAISMDYLERMKGLHPDLHTRISPFFIHFICSWWVNMLKEVVLHEELSEEEMACFVSEYIHFGTGGWKKLMHVPSKRTKP